jgi:pyrroloquinoline-quinone synthase
MAPMPELLSPQEFRTALEKAMEGRQAKDASFSRAWASGKLQRHHFARWAENHYAYVGPFADYLAYIYGNAPDHATDAKDFLLQNMYEEELSDDRHTDLLIRFAEACGTTADAVKDMSNITPMTRGLQGWCYALAMRENWVVATAALVVGLESQVPSIYRRQYPVLIDPEGYGFTEEEVEFFDLHITSDEVHGERGYQIVLKYADTPELQQRCIEVVRDGADMRFAYTKALYDTYVKPDLGEWSEAEQDLAVPAGLGSA